MDMRKFPFDTQRCKIDFEAWLHNDWWLQMEGRSVSAGLVNMQSASSLEYRLVDGGLSTIVSAETPSGTYTIIQFVLQLERYQGYYLTSVVFPSALLCIA